MEGAFWKTANVFLCAWDYNYPLFYSMGLFRLDKVGETNANKLEKA